MAALDTLGQVLAESRRLLQDTITPYRYPDADLVDALNLGILEARRIRADLFLPQKFALPYYDTTTIDMAAKFEVEPQFRHAFCYYIVGRMEMRDDEQTQDNRAVAMLGTWKSTLLGV
jgi:hypothetical protein